MRRDRVRPIAHELSHRQRDGLAVSHFSVREIYDGVLGSPAPKRSLAIARAFLEPLDLLTLDDTVMLQFARLRVDLRAQGQLIPGVDLLNAATALVYDLTLMTRNERHFRRILGLVIYKA